MRKKPKSEYVYVGCFLSTEGASRVRSHVGGKGLTMAIEHPHVTFDFQPTEPFAECFGEDVVFAVVGYGCDGRNEGIQVVVTEICDELLPAARIRPEHHITLSIAEGARAKDTGSLTFAPVEPLQIHATYGGFSYKRGVVLG